MGHKRKKAKAKSKSKKGKSKKNSKGKKKTKTKIVCRNKCRKAKIPKLPKPLKPLKLTALDMSVCGHGKNLGTLDIGYNCQSQFNPTCKRMVHRQNLPDKSKIAKMKKAAELLKRSKKSAKVRKPKKKWTLKGRYARFHKPKKLTYKQRKRLHEKKMRLLKKKNIKKWAKLAAEGRISYAGESKAQAKAKRMRARALAEKVLAGKMAAAKKALRLKTAKRMKEEAKRRKQAAWRRAHPEKAPYCVEAVEMNLSYCCLFHSRKAAQKLTNVEPAEPGFMRQVRRGWIAKKKDRERRAKEKIRADAEALKLM